MIGLGCFALAWAVARSCVQAVTGDEAQDYLLFARGDAGAHWTPSANNHMLNSLLERIFTSVFGLSALTVRIPNLLGAALYIYAAYKLCEMIAAEWKLRIPLFLCLVYNPFVFDFYVAARGYGIANAFLLSAIAVSAAWHLREEGERELIAATAISSAFIGIAFTANFSLAFPGGSTMLLLLVWAIKSAPRRWGKLIAAGLVPALLVVLILPSWTLLHFHESIVAGVKTLWETLITIANAAMYEPNPTLINPLLMPVFAVLRTILLPSVGVLALLQLGWMTRDHVWRRSGQAGPERNRHTAWLCALGTLISGAVILTVGEHRLAYRLVRLLMPASRTGLYFIPLTTLMVGIAAAIPPFSRAASISRKMLLGSLYVLAGYYFFCMRLTYFQEWDYQRDLNPAYKVMACYNHEKNVRDAATGWYYHAGMNFQRVLSGRETFPEFATGIPPVPGHDMYILEANLDGDFIKKQGLTIVYHAPHSALVIALRPELADGPDQGCSFQIN